MLLNKGSELKCHKYLVFTGMFRKGDLLITARIRMMEEGTVFSLFVSSHPGEGVPSQVPVPDGGVYLSLGPIQGVTLARSQMGGGVIHSGQDMGTPQSGLDGGTQADRAA